MSDATSGNFPEPPRPQATGRTLVLFDPKVGPAVAVKALGSIGAKAVQAREFGAAVGQMDSVLRQGDAIVFERFNVAVVQRPDNATQAVAALMKQEGVQRTRPEFFLFAIDELHERIGNWIRDGLQLLKDGAGESLTGSFVGKTLASALATPFGDTNSFTWGLAATGADKSKFTGRDIRVAVLDTGLDLGHPDFVGRSMVSQSFVPTEPSVQDGQGHGTHTAGTIAGPSNSAIGRRYGVAPDVTLHVGKVLDNGGTGREGDALNGMNWAIDQKCEIISMSLGRPTFSGEKPDPLYEEVGKAALREGSLVIAAAGNESARDFGFIAPVGAPANSPSIVAVAAVDPAMRVAEFSCGALNPDGGEVNISGPGVSVYSSFPRPRLSRLLPGTSMACPHVAGIAALWAQSNAALRGPALRDALINSARNLGNARDFGAGLVQAPDVGAEV